MGKSGVYGHTQINRRCREIARNLRKPVTQAARIALKPILLAARKHLLLNGTILTGITLKNIVIRLIKRTNAFAQYAVTLAGKAISRGHLIEFGTAPHFQPKLGRWHPGARPYPFLTPAYAENDRLSINIFGQEIGPLIDQQVRRSRVKYK